VPPPVEPEQPTTEREPWSAAAEERVCDALRFISSDGDRNQDWLTVGMALNWAGWWSGKTMRGKGIFWCLLLSSSLNRSQSWYDLKKKRSYLGDRKTRETSNKKDV
jgi:hypothetical protein